MCSEPFTQILERRLEERRNQYFLLPLSPSLRGRGCLYPHTWQCLNCSRVGREGWGSLSLELEGGGETNINQRDERGKDRGRKWRWRSIRDFSSASFCQNDSELFSGGDLITHSRTWKRKEWRTSFNCKSQQWSTINSHLPWARSSVKLMTFKIVRIFHYFISNSSSLITFIVSITIEGNHQTSRVSHASATSSTVSVWWRT